MRRGLSHEGLLTVERVLGWIGGNAMAGSGTVYGDSRRLPLAPAGHVDWAGGAGAALRWSRRGVSVIKSCFEPGSLIPLAD